MARTKRVFFSDMHMSTKNLQDSGHARYRAAHRKRLLASLDKHIIRESESIKDVILLGDIFDNWVCPANIEPPTWEEIFTDNDQECSVFKDIISKDINLFYIPGNHDFDVPKDLLEHHIPGIRLIKSYKGAGRSHAEHGHEHTLFNRPDYLNDPGFGRPIGYFIARLFASCPQVGHCFGDILDYLEDVRKQAGPTKNLFSLLIEALAQRADVDEIVMPGQKTISVKAVKKRYRDLGRQHGLNSFKLAMYITREKLLGEVADDLCKDWGFNVILFGHTHHAKIDKDVFFVEDRIYVNTGAWCSEKAHFTTLDKAADTRVTLTLFQVDEGGNIIDADTKVLE